MKHVFNSSEVPHIWAQQKQLAGRNSQGNLYFEGATIYSYGAHFPIATIEGNDVFFTKRNYSNTTSKHKLKTWRAVSDRNIIDCYEVPKKWDEKPLKKQILTGTHLKNIEQWKSDIKEVLQELGNKRNGDISSRVHRLNGYVNELRTYCDYFKYKIKDKELNKLLKLAASDDLVNRAKEAEEIAQKAKKEKLKKAKVAYETYMKYWREFNQPAILHMPENTEQLARYYTINAETFTHLRFNTDKNRVETSKGVQIPAEIAKRAYLQLNGCMEGICDSISVPVMEYTITKTTKDAIIAGCHTIPKEDIKYIADLLGW